MLEELQAKESSRISLFISYVGRQSPNMQRLIATSLPSHVHQKDPRIHLNKAASQHIVQLSMDAKQLKFDQTVTKPHT